MSVCYCRNGNDCVLVVAADGMGLTSARNQGTGLGQRPVGSLVSQLDGILNMDSDANGTRVTVRFPADHRQRNMAL